MADSTNTPLSSSGPNHSSSEDKKRMVRGCTKMLKIAKVRKTSVKLKIEFDPQTGDCIGENSNEFRSYAAYLARSTCSILIDEWRLVDVDSKNSIWDDLKLHFDIIESDDSNKCDLKKKWLKYLGDRWRAFKTQLTSDYITNPNPNRLPPYEVYPYIKEDVWEKFLEHRNTPAFKEKSKKGKDNVAKNLYPHTLSRGGYELLEKKMINEKRQELDASIELDRIPSPPSRHDKWKRARQRRRGEYTSEATRVVAEKIDSLAEETEQGTFVSQGRDDILTKAIGASEHGGRVRGVGRFANLSNYFGRSSRPTQSIDVKEIEAQLEAKLEQKLAAKIKAECKEKFEQQLIMASEKMQQSFMETLKTMGLSEISPTNQQGEQNVLLHGSTKGSCTAAQENHKEDSTTDNVQRVLFMFLKQQQHICLPLQHDLAVKNFWISPMCIRELLVGDAWLDISILQVCCT
ncbi:uncharacterized protein LOC130744462 [Lotus japonicus]|uniref:uncharacterized protein LOC130744462 n=1 Tax=Lotus japonicus TaxID=34305 RepID=UPI0025905454|nr:uncharacterized protein LOC130744462 [Lotus japonicus]